MTQHDKKPHLSERPGRAPSPGTFFPKKWNALNTRRVNIFQRVKISEAFHLCRLTIIPNPSFCCFRRGFRRRVATVVLTWNISIHIFSSKNITQVQRSRLTFWGRSRSSGRELLGFYCFPHCTKRTHFFEPCMQLAIPWGNSRRFLLPPHQSQFLDPWVLVPCLGSLRWFSNLSNVKCPCPKRC